MSQTYTVDAYPLVAEAIAYLLEHRLEQPSLEDLSRGLGRSPWQLQRTFREWAGVSPKTFLGYLSLQHAKALLHERQTLLEASLNSGLSGSGRLHDLFVHIEAMTPGDYRRGARGLEIRWELMDSPFGPMLAAATPRGLCRLVFTEHPQAAVQELREEFPSPRILEAPLQQGEALRALLGTGSLPSGQLRLHLKGSPFQLKVWEALLKIPSGSVESYSGLAARLGQPRAARALGSAVAANPVACLIPCHRVIQASGIFGQYRWQASRKAALLGWESARRFGEAAPQTDLNSGS